MVILDPSLLSGSEFVCTKTSEQPTGHSGLTSKAEEEDFKVSRFQRVESAMYV